jgi:probable rRNA maturation factor
VLEVAIVAAPADRAAVRGLAPWLARTAPRALRGTITIAIVTDARMRALNTQFRQVNAATDVLSFPSLGGLDLGDIAIARGVAARQAKAAGHALATEVRVLALHGLLHLAGYDHETDDGAMARVEARLRRKGGLAGGLIERAKTPAAAARRTRP